MDDNSLTHIKIKRRKKEQSIIGERHYTLDNNIKKLNRRHFTTISLKTFKISNPLITFNIKNLSKEKKSKFKNSFIFQKIKYILANNRDKYLKEFNRNYNKMFVHNLLVKEKNIIKTKYIEALCCCESKEILLHYYSKKESKIMLLYLTSLFNKFTIIYPNYSQNETICHIMMNYLENKDKFIQRTEQNQKEYLLKENLIKFHSIHSKLNKDDTKFFNSSLSDSSDSTFNYKYKLNLFSSNKGALNYFECENSTESLNNINTLIEHISTSEKISEEINRKKNMIKVKSQNGTIDTNSTNKNEPIKIKNVQKNLKLIKNSIIANRRHSVASEINLLKNKHGVLITTNNQHLIDDKKNKINKIKTNNIDEGNKLKKRDGNKVRKRFKSSELFILESIRKKVSNKETLKNSIFKLIYLYKNNEKTEANKNIKNFKYKNHKSYTNLKFDINNNKNVTISTSGNSDIKYLESFKRNDFQFNRNSLTNNNYYNHPKISYCFSDIFNKNKNKNLRIEKVNKERMESNLNYLLKNNDLNFNHKKNENKKSKIFYSYNSFNRRNKKKIKLNINIPKNSKITYNKSNKELIKRNEKFLFENTDSNKCLPFSYTNKATSTEKKIYDNNQRLNTINTYRKNRFLIPKI